MGEQSKLVGWKRALAICAILLVLPVMPEIIIFLDVIGLEATLLFLLVWGQSVFQELASRASYAYYYVESSVLSKRTYRPQVDFGFSLSASASLATLFLTGSLVLAIFAWGPLFVSVSSVTA